VSGNRLPLPFFGVFFCAVVTVVTLHIAYVLLKVAPGSLAWLGAAVSVWPITLLLIRLSITRAQRQVSSYLGIRLLTVLGCSISLYDIFSTEVHLWLLVLVYGFVVGFGGIVAIDRGLVLTLKNADSAL